MQAVAPTFEYFPAGQAEQALVEVVELGLAVPAEHREHRDEGPPLLCDPAGQAIKQLEEPGNEYSSKKQERQSDDEVDPETPI